MEVKIQKVKKYWKTMEIVQIKYLIVVVLIFNTLLGCTQEKSISEDPYYEFKKEVYTKLKYPDYDEVLNECLLDGFVLALIKVGENGFVEYDLLYSTNEVFKKTYFDNLKKLDFTSLKYGKNYLIPITFKFRIRDSLLCKPKTDRKKYYQWSSDLNGGFTVDHYFEPFEFYLFSPIH